MTGHDLIWVLGFLFAIAIGWVLGRFDLLGKKKRRSSLAGEYLKGLNHLLNQRPDEAIALFIKALDGNANAVETHLVLGRLFRSRGEIDKATAVHQRLLARENLSAEQSSLAQFELASDFMAAGLLDRAERLLKELGARAGEQAEPSLALLMEIYQREKEWEQAIAVALDLLPRQQARIAPILAQYLCESAFICSGQGDLSSARRKLKRALDYDPNCVRASLLLGHLEVQSGRYREAIKAFQQVKEQDAAYLPESIPYLANCYGQLGKRDELQTFLRQCLEEYPSVTALLGLADLLCDDPRSLEQVQQFIKAELTRRPSLKGIARLLDLQLQGSANADQQRLSELRELIRLLIDSKPVYRCSHCGYAGKQLNWLCPGCEQWGKIKPIYGLEGE